MPKYRSFYVQQSDWWFVEIALCTFLCIFLKKVLLPYFQLCYIKWSKSVVILKYKFGHLYRPLQSTVARTKGNHEYSSGCALFESIRKQSSLHCKKAKYLYHRYILLTICLHRNCECGSIKWWVIVVVVELYITLYITVSQHLSSFKVRYFWQVNIFLPAVVLPNVHRWCITREQFYCSPCAWLD